MWARYELWASFFSRKPFTRDVRSKPPPSPLRNGGGGGEGERGDSKAKTFVCCRCKEITSICLALGGAVYTLSVLSRLSEEGYDQLCHSRRHVHTKLTNVTIGLCRRKARKIRP